MSERILSSQHNPRLRAAMALRDARERRQRSEILIDGAREIDRAASSGVAMLVVYAAMPRIEAAGTEARRALVSARRAGAEIVEVTPEIIDRLGYGERNEGLVAVAEMPSVDLEDIDLPDMPLVGVVEGVEKPGNLGAILRSADGAGLHALIVADGGTDPFNPNVIRASLGTVFSVPIAVAPTAEVVAWLAENDVRVIAARVDGGDDYASTDLRGSLAIALGSEAKGLSDAWSGPDVVAVRLPMLGIADSLNVSATAAILFYEALRQRTAAGRTT